MSYGACSMKCFAAVNSTGTRLRRLRMCNGSQAGDVGIRVWNGGDSNAEWQVIQVNNPPRYSSCV